MEVPAWHKTQYLTADSFLRWEEYLFTRGLFAGAESGIERIKPESVTMEEGQVRVRDVSGLTRSGYPVVIAGDQSLTAGWDQKPGTKHIFIAVHTVRSKELSDGKQPEKFWLRLSDKLPEQSTGDYLYLGEWESKENKLTLRNKPLPRTLGALRPVLGEEVWWEWTKPLFDEIEKLNEKNSASGLSFLPCLTIVGMSQLSMLLFRCSPLLRDGNRRPGLTPKEEDLLREKQKELQSLDDAKNLIDKLIALLFPDRNFYKYNEDFKITKSTGQRDEYILEACEGKTLCVSGLRLSVSKDIMPPLSYKSSGLRVDNVNVTWVESNWDVQFQREEELSAHESLVLKNVKLQDGQPEPWIAVRKGSKQS